MGPHCAGSTASRIQERAPSATSSRRPYSCFFFKYDDAELALPAVRLLAYGLSFLSDLGELVVQALKQSDDTRVHPTMEEQLMALIVTPLQEFTAICPETTVVLVIDDVDECPADTRPAFLTALRAGILHLRANVFLAIRPALPVNFPTTLIPMRTSRVVVSVHQPSLPQRVRKA